MSGRCDNEIAVPDLHLWKGSKCALLGRWPSIWHRVEPPPHNRKMFRPRFPRAYGMVSGMK